MIKKYLIWSFFAVIIGFSSGYFLLKFTIISASYVYDFVSNDKNEFSMEEISDTEEVKVNDVISDYNNPIMPDEILDSSIFNKNVINNIEKSWGTVKGLTMFRGNLTRSWYGTGPIPNTPQTKWKYPDEKMCSKSSTGGKIYTWCGSGWTGQPVVWEKENGDEEVIFGAYDRSVHFVDAKTGKDTRTLFKTGDIIKGSVTLDPDGFPLLYFGSRDNKLRILSLDNEKPTELWSLDSRNFSGIWNDDWDGNPAIINDILYVGGENGWFYAIKLNRKINANNKVEVSPKMIFSMPSYNKELIDLVGKNVSIENSLAFFDNRVYFANSGGRVIGLDISNIENSITPIVFDYWVGDDVDATIVIDSDGMLYVSVESERFNERSKELGQFIKLDPYTTSNPYVWGIKLSNNNSIAGIWATPALYKDYLYVPTHTGKLLGVNKNTGDIVWEEKIAYHSWSSPVIIDNKLLIGTCDGHLKNYSLENPEKPILDWSYLLGSGSCIESTPAVWNGNIYVGSRDGYFYKVGEKN